MKLTHIAAIIALAIAVAVLVSTAGDASTYVTFKEAEEMAAEGNNNKIHVVGAVKKDARGQLVDYVYQPQQDPNYFSFQLTDDSLKTREVVYFQPKPQDFERAEKIVVIGSVKGKTFVADKILLKCPSKYVDENVKLEGAAKQASL